MIGLTAACMLAVVVAFARRLLVGRIRTLPVRGVAAGVAVVSTFALCAWAFGGPLQSGLGPEGRDTAVDSDVGMECPPGNDRLGTDSPTR